MSSGFFSYENDPDPYKGLGEPRQEHDHLCSLCDKPIPDGHEALQLWAEGRNLMWLYCERCEPIITATYKRAPK